MQKLPGRTSVEFMCMREDGGIPLNVRVVSGVMSWVVFLEYQGKQFTVDLDEYPTSDNLQQLIYAVVEYVQTIDNAISKLYSLDIQHQ